MKEGSVGSRPVQHNTGVLKLVLNADFADALDKCNRGVSAEECHSAASTMYYC